MKFCQENLKMQQVDIEQIKLDRAHKMGVKRRNSIRPIVVKFYDYAGTKMQPLYRAIQRNTCAAFSQPVCYVSVGRYPF